MVLRLRQPIRRIGLTHTSNPALFPEGRLSAESCADSTLPERPICIGRTLSREALVQGAPASGKLPPGGLLCGGPHKFSSSQQQHLFQGAVIVLPKMCVNHLYKCEKRACVQEKPKPLIYIGVRLLSGNFRCFLLHRHLDFLGCDLDLCIFLPLLFPFFKLFNLSIFKKQSCVMKNIQKKAKK